MQPQKILKIHIIVSYGTGKDEDYTYSVRIQAYFDGI